MKKTYIQPLTNEVKIKVEQMICQSPAAPTMYNANATGEAMDKEDFDSSDDLW